MIHVNQGRASTQRTDDEVVTSAQTAFADLSPDEQKAVLMILEEVTAGGQELVELLNVSHWARPPISMEQFLEDDYYMGIPGASLYPKIKEDLIRLFDNGDYSEVICAGSIGWGKSMTASFIAARVLYEISCLRDPQRTFGLSPGSEIHLALISKNLEQTKKVLANKIIEPMRLSPYFQEHFMWKTRHDGDEFVFPGNVIMFVASIGSTDRILGANLFAAFVDEVNFLGAHSQAKLDTSDGRKGLAAYDKADKLYHNLVRRIKSRFSSNGKLPGKLCLISSKTVKNSFTERRIRESVNDPSVFVLDYATWHVKPASSFSGKFFKILVGGTTARSRILGPEEVPNPQFLVETSSYVIEVPEEYREDFVGDLNGSLRDIAGVSVEAISQFIARQEKIYDAHANADKEGMRHPFTVEEWTYGEPGEFKWSVFAETYERKIAGGYTETAWRPKRHPKASRHVHIDVAISGDSLGIAMGHVARLRSVVRRDPDGVKYSDLAQEVEIDFMLRICPPAGEQIFLPDIRAMVYALIDHGFPITSFSCDSYQSTEMLQQVKTRGVKSEVISVDRTTAAYDEMRQALYEDRLKTYQYQPFLDEALALEFDSARGKVDHPVGGGKDVADAVAGVLDGLKRNASRAPLPMMVGDAEDAEPDDQAWVMGGKKVVQVTKKKAPPPFISG